MAVLDALIACAGAWRGTNVLQDPHSGRPEQSTGAATVTPVLAGRFVRLDYAWGYQGKPQAGSLLLGFDGDAGRVTGYWVDTWHMSHKAMVCSGPRPTGPTLAVAGTYAAPPGPDWGWRIEVTPAAGRSLRTVMWNLWPQGGREELAMDSSYSPA